MGSKRFSQRGVTGVDVITVLAVGAVLSATAIVASASIRGGAHSDLHPMTMRDQQQMARIHSSFIVFAHSDGGRYPRPGRIHRGPTQVGPGTKGQHVPGMGPEAVERNTTAALYSGMIAQEYFNSDVVVSPVERNPNVGPIGQYNYEAYHPGGDPASYWDHRFNADLEHESHTSYAHLVMYGERMEKNWRDISETTKPVLANRGPEDGELRPHSYTTGMHGHWRGNVIFNDNSVRLLNSATPEELVYSAEGETKQDNLFRVLDGIGGADVILTFTQSMDPDDGPEMQFD